jgi:hypothetical protein
MTDNATHTPRGVAKFSQTFSFTFVQFSSLLAVSWEEEKKLGAMSATVK